MIVGNMGIIFVGNMGCRTCGFVGELGKTPCYDNFVGQMGKTPTQDELDVVNTGKTPLEEEKCRRHEKHTRRGRNCRASGMSET